MKPNIRTIAGILSFIVATQAVAITDSVGVITKLKNGGATEENVKLEKIDAKTMRLRIPFKKHSRGKWLQIDYIDIVNPCSSSFSISF